MNGRWEEFSEHLEVQAIDDGSETVFRVYQTVIEHRPIAGPVQQSRGMRRITTANGRPVNLKSDGTCTLVELDTGREFFAMRLRDWMKPRT